MEKERKKTFGPIPLASALLIAPHFFSRAAHEQRTSEGAVSESSQGLLGPDDDQADPLLLAPGDDGGVVCDVEGRDGGHRGLERDPGVGGSAEQRAAARGGAQLPRQRVLPPAGAHD